MATGISTANITSASTITEVVGNQRLDANNVQTVRVPIDAVANQMVGDGPLADEIAALRTERAAGDAAVEAKITANNLGATQATTAEAIDGSNTSHWLSPAQAKAAIDARLPPVVQAQAVAVEQINLFTAGETAFTDATNLHYSTAQVVPVRDVVSDVPCWKATCPANSQYSLLQRRFAVSEFGTATKISAAVTIAAMDIGSGTSVPRVLLRQFNSSNTEISAVRQTQTFGSSAAMSSPVTVKFEGVALDASCAVVELYIDFGGIMTVNRSIWYTSMLMAAGLSASWRKSAARVPPELSLLPDDSFANTLVLSSGGSGTWSISNVSGVYELYASAAATGNPTRYYDVLAVGKLAPGSQIQGIIDLMSSVAAGAELALIFLDSSGSEISRLTGKNTSVNQYDTVRVSGTVPANTATIRYRLVAWMTNSPTATYAKWRKPALLATTDTSIPQTRIFAPSTPLIGASHLSVRISPTGSDTTGDGSAANPYATPDKALSVMRGVGEIICAPGVYGALQFDASKMTDMAIIGMEDSALNRARFRHGTKLTGIVLVSGATKTHEATIALAGTPNFIWHDDVADPNTAVTSADQHFGLRGRANRLPATRISKCDATTRAAAITEIEGASDPRCFWDSANGKLLFSIASGGDATSANIYVPTTGTLFKGGGSVWLPSGKIVRISGINLRYGGFNLDTCFMKSYVEDCAVMGAPVNGFATSLYAELTACEAMGSGSFNTSNGDGFNWHAAGHIVHRFLYSHDNFDDGMSSHENCFEHGFGAVSEYNVGSGYAPAYGSQAVYENCLARRNAVHARFYAGKAGGFEAHAANTGGGDDVSTLTSMECFNCISIGDRNGFWDYFIASGANSVGKAYGCAAIDPVNYGFALSSIFDCRHVGTGTAKSPGSGGRSVTVRNTNIVT